MFGIPHSQTQLDMKIEFVVSYQDVFNFSEFRKVIILSAYHHSTMSFVHSPMYLDPLCPMYTLWIVNT